MNNTLFVRCNVQTIIFTKRRTWAKAFAWRIIATLTGAAVAGIITGEIETAGWFIVIEFPLKMSFYYIHERVWEKVRWGVESSGLVT